MTRDRWPSLDRSLRHLARVSGVGQIIVVDNGSGDGTVEGLLRHHPSVQVVALDTNAGVAARNVAVEQAECPYVAFADDDSWWAPGSLELAARILDRHPSIGAIAARILVGPEEREDPIAGAMRSSPVTGDPSLPGTPVLGFLACATVVRRSAFLAVGGFEARLHFAGEEQLLAADLAAAGWEIRYVPDVVAHHHPSPSRDTRWRRRRELRNHLWFLWLRRPALRAVTRSVASLRRSGLGRDTAAGAMEALRGLPWVLRARHPVPDGVEQSLRAMEAR